MKHLELHRGQKVRLARNPRAYEVRAVAGDGGEVSSVMAGLAALSPSVRWVRIADLETGILRTCCASDVVEILE